MFPSMSAAFDGLRRHDFPRIRQATHPRYPTYKSAQTPLFGGPSPLDQGRGLMTLSVERRRAMPR